MLPTSLTCLAVILFNVAGSPFPQFFRFGAVAIRIASYTFREVTLCYDIVALVHRFGLCPTSSIATERAKPICSRLRTIVWLLRSCEARLTIKS
jgi:hypothetical protein